VRLQFDGKHAQLYLNGKLDGSVETPPPAAGARELQIGSASGKDYNLEGAIERDCHPRACGAVSAAAGKSDHRSPRTRGERQ